MEALGYQKPGPKPNLLSGPQTKFGLIDKYPDSQMHTLSHYLDAKPSLQNYCGVSKKIPDPPNEDKRRAADWQDDIRLEQEYQTSWQSISGHAGLSICKAERAQPPDLICRQHRPHNSATTIFWEETLLTRLPSSSVVNMDFLHHVQSDLVIPLCYILGVIHGVANSKDLMRWLIEALCLDPVKDYGG